MSAKVCTLDSHHGDVRDVHLRHFETSLVFWWLEDNFPSIHHAVLARSRLLHPCESECDAFLGALDLPQTWQYCQNCQMTKGSVSYLSSPCFSTSLGGIGGPARAIHGILAVMYWISIIRGGPPPSRKWSWVQFPRVTRSRAPTLEAHFP